MDLNSYPCCSFQLDPLRSSVRDLTTPTDSLFFFFYAYSRSFRYAHHSSNFSIFFPSSAYTAFVFLLFTHFRTFCLFPRTRIFDLFFSSAYLRAAISHARFLPYLCSLTFTCLPTHLPASFLPASRRPIHTHVPAYPYPLTHARNAMT